MEDQCLMFSGDTFKCRLVLFISSSITEKLKSCLRKKANEIKYVNKNFFKKMLNTWMGFIKCSKNNVKWHIKTTNDNKWLLEMKYIVPLIFDRYGVLLILILVLILFCVVLPCHLSCLWHGMVFWLYFIRFNLLATLKIFILFIYFS